MVSPVDEEGRHGGVGGGLKVDGGVADEEDLGWGHLQLCSDAQRSFRGGLGAGVGL